MDDYINEVTNSISNIDYYNKALSDENKSLTKEIRMKKIKKFFVNLTCRTLSMGLFFGLPIGALFIMNASYAAMEAGKVYGIIGFSLPVLANLVFFLPNLILVIDSDTPAYHIEINEINPLIESKQKTSKMLFELENASSRLEKVVSQEVVDLDVLYDRKNYLTNKIDGITNKKQLVAYKDLLNIYNKKIKALELKKQYEDTSNLVQGFNPAAYYDSISDNNLSGQYAVKELKF